MTAPIVGPVALYSNLPINAQYYQPSLFEISAITLGMTTTVTTSVDHNFVVGQVIRTIIPPRFGTRQMNELQAIVLDVPETDEVVLNINSSQFDAFVLATGSTPAQIFSIGDVNSGQTNSNGPANQITYIPGSFINISPN